MAGRALRKSEVRSQKSEVRSQKSEVSNLKPEIPVARRQSPLELDRLIHERLRLGIVSALAANESLTFNDLKKLLNATDGNLSVHARKLEEADYIVCAKSFEGRVPRSEYRLTAAGRRALEKYVSHMEAILKAVKD
jgi:DNA-binding HxlR family transcriptional regulator